MSILKLSKQMTPGFSNIWQVIAKNKLNNQNETNEH